MAGDLILITGVSGFIGFKTLILALESGFTVRAVIRKSEQAAKLESHNRVAPHKGNLQWVVIPNLSDTHSFDKHLTGVTGILHIASPLAHESDDYQRDIIDPALKVTQSILSAAHRAPSIKRVVITSSAVTLVPFAWMFGPAPPSPDLTIFTAADINSNNAGPYSSSIEAYFASKALARIATKKFMDEEKPAFEFVNLLPSVVVGPDELATNAAEVLKGGNQFTLGPLLDANIPQMVGAAVHVDDVVRAHIDALKPGVQGNREYILSSDAPDGINWDDVQQHVKKSFPEAVEKGTLKLGASVTARPWRLDAQATEKAFGWKFAPFTETLGEVVEQYLKFVEVEKK
ncbi:NAD(P)-binding Rossmann-fold containing protein [Glarea lozoyensis ATCC 20868]|uniref:NAD(P)-binding Rossmann-fold containing protein n=1 Tax=Glarea lozoyensis (strain ATCC 20868 / MF5171) TaxID=1116229 RepID=S3DF70_GLAL2|nr:NAD(P)-binding Rossmann-fold containing protein [Glarea lozoyensis ATCC 20868]EPE35749.1 NAD(P)-binding Rossmann-fold containing protein [Glarea lozoyensis ATCC 20868]